MTLKPYLSNCLVEAVIAKIKNPKIKLYLWKDHKKRFHGLHIYWLDAGKYYHHTMPNPNDITNLFEFMIHEGSIQELIGKIKESVNV